MSDSRAIDRIEADSDAEHYLSAGERGPLHGPACICLRCKSRRRRPQRAALIERRVVLVVVQPRRADAYTHITIE